MTATNSPTSAAQEWPSDEMLRALLAAMSIFPAIGPTGQGAYKNQVAWYAVDFVHETIRSWLASLPPSPELVAARKALKDQNDLHAETCCQYEAQIEMWKKSSNAAVEEGDGLQAECEKLQAEVERLTALLDERERDLGRTILGLEAEVTRLSGLVRCQKHDQHVVFCPVCFGEAVETARQRPGCSGCEKLESRLAEVYALTAHDIERFASDRDAAKVELERLKIALADSESVVRRHVGTEAAMSVWRNAHACMLAERDAALDELQTVRRQKTEDAQSAIVQLEAYIQARNEEQRRAHKAEAERDFYRQRYEALRKAAEEMYVAIEPGASKHDFVSAARHLRKALLTEEPEKDAQSICPHGRADRAHCRICVPKERKA